MSKPYCGIRKLPKNRVRGTSQQYIKSGQARYYGIMSVENEINTILAEKRKLANKKAKIKRQNAKQKVADANKKIKQANTAVKEANKAKTESKKAEKEAKNSIANIPITSTKKIKPTQIGNNKAIKDIGLTIKNVSSGKKPKGRPKKTAATNTATKKRMSDYELLKAIGVPEEKMGNVKGKPKK